MSSYFLGVDTSNYTTSLCLVKDGRIAAEARRLLPVSEGQRGLRQSDAVFLHTKALPELLTELSDTCHVPRTEIAAVGVSTRPRDAEGSYMPCFLAGVSFASAFAGALDIPLYTFSHQCGHIAAAVCSAGKTELFEKEFLSFHVSGGTTELLHVTPLKTGLICTAIGGTLDLNAGQAIDRTGVALGLAFPCGAQMDKLAQSSDKRYAPKVAVNGTECSLSGLENQTKKMLADGERPEDICRYAFSYVGNTLQRMTENARVAYPRLPVLYAGGVMCNSRIREQLSQNTDVWFADARYSCDNAYGTAMLAAYRHAGDYPANERELS